MHDFNSKQEEEIHKFETVLNFLAKDPQYERSEYLRSIFRLMDNYENFIRKKLVPYLKTKTSAFIVYELDLLNKDLERPVVDDPVFDPEQPP